MQLIVFVVLHCCLGRARSVYWVVVVQVAMALIVMNCLRCVAMLPRTSLCVALSVCGASGKSIAFDWLSSLHCCLGRASSLH